MEKYILDANLFFNMEAGVNMGGKTETVVVSLTEIIRKLHEAKKAEFFMPAKVVEEFLSFFEDKNQGFIKNFLAVITVKTPELSQINLSAQLFSKLIEDIRSRSYRGMAVAEEEIGRASRLMAGQVDLNKKDFEIKIGSVIRSFRDRYRRATRYGFLDSLADLDLILLSKEQNGFLVTTDEGVASWGRLFGVREMPVVAWRRRLEDLARS